MKLALGLITMLACSCALCADSPPEFVKRLRYTRIDKDVGETTGHGTAFGIAPRKLLTAAHNVMHEGKLLDTVTVEVGDRWIACKVVEVCADADIAVLSVEENLAYASFGDDPTPDAGVLLYGSLHGEKVTERAGIVTAPYKAGLRFLASTSCFGHGCSGGPVCQGKRIVGMIVAGVPDGKGDMKADACYFVPASALKYVAGIK